MTLRDEREAAEPEPATPEEPAPEEPLPVLAEVAAHEHGPDREAELVAESADAEAADGPGAEVHVDEPWEGYRRMTAAQIVERLDREPDAAAAVVRLFELSHRRRAQVLRATERALAGSEGPHTRRGPPGGGPLRRLRLRARARPRRPAAARRGAAAASRGR